LLFALELVGEFLLVSVARFLLDGFALFDRKR